jgi:hypothetical protein
MIGDQGPCVTGRTGLFQEIIESFQEVIPIRIIPKYLSAFDPPDHDVVQRTRRI